MQPAERGDALGGRPQHQMIGVAQNDVGAAGAHVGEMHGLDGRLRADRHEGRRAHDAMRGRDLALAGGAVGGENSKAEEQFLIHTRPFFS